MPVENVKKFYDAITNDEGLKEKLTELSRNYRGEAASGDARSRIVSESILPLAEELGMAFTLEDLKQYEQEMNQARGGSGLSDDELQTVVGGYTDDGWCLIGGWDENGNYLFGLCWIYGVFWT